MDTKSELEQTRSKLKTVHQELKMVEATIDTVDDIAVYSFNKETEDLYISKGAEKIYGFPHQQLVEKKLWKKAVHPEDKEKYEKREEKIYHGEPVMTELRIMKPSGDIRWIILRDTPVLDSFEEVIGYTGNIIDITDRKQLEIKLKQLAYYDDLTDLANRTLLDRHLKKAMARSKRKSHPLCVMFIDLDGFKNVNDTLGHETGDLLLKEVAKRLNESVRDEDFISRLGGDEFIIVFEETDKHEVQDIAERVLTNISKPYNLEGKQAKVTPSIGISMYPDDGADRETLLNNADKAMYFAKNKGKSNYQFYSAELPELPSKKTGIFQKIVHQIQGGLSR